MSHRVVNITEFKARCLSLLDGVGKGEGSITITKRGRPLATVTPARPPAWKSPEGAWSGKVKLAGGLETADTSGLWDVLRRPSEPRR